MASVRKRGNNYQITVSNGRDSQGKQLIETATFTPDSNKTAKQNQKALEKFVFEFEEKVKSGKYLNGEKITFKDFTEIWLSDYAEKQLESTTISTYKYLLDAHIIPVIGHLKLSKLQPRHLNKLYDKLASERKDGRDGGYSPKTIRHVHNIISGIYTTAMKWNIVMENPCERVSPPKMARTCDKIKYFSLEQAEVFLGLLDREYTSSYKAHDRIDDTGKQYHVCDYTETRKVPTQFRLFFLLALFCGMRRGELIALEWSDIDFQKNSISITKSTANVNGKPVTKSPKTKSSVRLISVPKSVMEVAREYRKEQLEYRLSLGTQWEGENHIFIQWNGKQMHLDTPYNTFKKIIRRYNEQVTAPDKKLPEIPLHGLRHTSATLLISQNMDPRTVSNRLGHAQTSTTMDIYSHALKRMDEKAADVFDDLFSRKA
ncbi:site-specific integrase [Blautia schinkii]|nr:site-specific integrase [Blautia schinkii]